MDGKVGALGEIVAQPPIGVLVRRSLPIGCGSRKLTFIPVAAVIAVWPAI